MALVLGQDLVLAPGLALVLDPVQGQDLALALDRVPLLFFFDFRKCVIFYDHKCDIHCHS